MIRDFVCILLFSTLLVCTHQSSLPSISFNKGKINLRNLEAAAASVSGEKLDFSANYSINNAVKVDLGAEYLSKAGLKRNINTEMLLFLYTNITGFCADCQEFSAYVCGDNKECTAEVSRTQAMVSPYYTVKQGVPITHSLTIGSNLNSWQLQTPALYYSKSDRQLSKIYTANSAKREYAQENTYGFIGLGVGGNASKNFQNAKGPLFSIKINSSGNGSLIFGKDEAFYVKNGTTTNLTTDTNWTMKTSNMTFGPSISVSDFKSSLTFDLQFPGIGIPYSHYIAGPNVFTQLRNIYNLTHNGSFGDSYPYVYYGDLGNLPNLTFGFQNGEKLEIPPSAYTRALGNNTYQILLGYVGKVYNGSQHLDHTVLGWPVLSQFYSVFEQKQGSEPTITLYQLSNVFALETNPKDQILMYAIFGLIGFILVTCISIMIFKKKAASKLKGELREDLTKSNSFLTY